MFEPDQGAAPGLWKPGWVNLGNGSYPVSAISENLLQDMTEWVMVYERAYLAGGSRAINSLASDWYSEGYLLVARVNVELMPLGYAVWPAFEWTSDSLVPRKMRADFRKKRLRISDAQMLLLIESSNDLLAAHRLPLIPAAGSNRPPPTGT
jgi:hypothetical protein